MELKLDRTWKKDTYVIGNLYIDGVWFCNTVEDKDRGLKSTMSLEEIKKIKVYAQTAIPTGRYKVTVNTVSPKFSKKQFYKTICDGKVPRLLKVPGYDGILIHCGSTANSSAGCIIVGHNKIKGGVTKSQEVFVTLYEILRKAADRGEDIYITIE